MPLASPWPSLAPYPTEPAWTFLARAAQRTPHQPAVIGLDGQSATYGELWDRSRRLARFLQRDANVVPGDTVAVAAPGSRDTAAILHAAWLAGARVSFLNAFQRPAEMAHYLADAEVAVAFVSASAAPALNEARQLADFQCLRHVYRSAQVWDLTDAEPPRPEPIAVDPARQDALLVYSSGTTGWPVAARQSHLNRVAAARQRLAVLPLPRGTVVLSLRPFWTDISCCIAARVPLVTGADPQPAAIRAALQQRTVLHARVLDLD